VSFSLTDHENSVRDLVTYDSGTDTTTIANHRIYDAYGNLTSETDSAVDCLFGYTGRMFDESTGLQNNLNRWYDPTTGRWLSQDPIGFNGGDANLYRYCENSPTNYIDPSGYCHVETGDNGEDDGDIHFGLNLDGLDGLTAQGNGHGGHVEVTANTGGVHATGSTDSGYHATGDVDYTGHGSLNLTIPGSALNLSNDIGLAASNVGNNTFSVNTSWDSSNHTVQLGVGTNTAGNISGSANTTFDLGGISVGVGLGNIGNGSPTFTISSSFSLGGLPISTSLNYSDHQYTVGANFPLGLHLQHSN
jgi:RHS repeat-associated protein